MMESQLWTPKAPFKNTPTVCGSLSPTLFTVSRDIAVGFWGQDIGSAHDSEYDSYVNGQGSSTTISSTQSSTSSGPTPTATPPSNPVGTFDYIVVCIFFSILSFLEIWSITRSVPVPEVW